MFKKKKKNYKTDSDYPFGIFKRFWKNIILQNNLSCFIDLIFVCLCIWSLYIFRADSTFLPHGLGSEQLRVKFDGTIQTVAFGQLKTICDVDPEHFPFDCHKCDVRIGSSLASTFQSFKWKKVDPFTQLDKVRHSNAIWKIESVTVEEFGPPIATTAILNIYLKRLPTFYLFNIVIPSSALSFLCLCTFYIPVVEGERITFGVTILLSFLVLMLHISDLLPESSKKTSAVGKIL
jgi:hypothetical protein